MPPRLKDLPNIGRGIERLLWKASIQMRMRWRNIKRDLSVKVLLALEEALAWRHLAALPQCLRNELMEWWQRRHACR